MVGVDCIFIKDVFKKTWAWLNVVCWGTCFQQCAPVGEPDDGEGLTAKKGWQAFCNCWLRWLGPPDVIVCDQGNEFKGEFAERASGIGISLHVIDSRAPH